MYCEQYEPTQALFMALGKRPPKKKHTRSSAVMDELGQRNAKDILSSAECPPFAPNIHSTIYSTVTNKGPANLKHAMANCRHTLAATCGRRWRLFSPLKAKSPSLERMRVAAGAHADAKANDAQAGPLVRADAQRAMRFTCAKVKPGSVHKSHWSKLF